MKKLNKKEKNALIGELASGIIHSINNPLTAISMMSDKIQYLVDEYREGEELDSEGIQNANRIISKTIADLAPLLNSINNFSRETSEDSFTSNDVKSIENNVLHMVHHLLNKNKVKLNWEYVLPEEEMVYKGNINNVSFSIISFIKNSLRSIDENFDGKRTLDINIVFDKELLSFNIKSNYEKENISFDGLGLNMAVDLIEMYSGKIDKKSSTQLVVSLPSL